VFTETDIVSQSISFNRIYEYLKTNKTKREIQDNKSWCNGYCIEFILVNKLILVY
jgi:hypothetical protein